MLIIKINGAFFSHKQFHTVRLIMLLDGDPDEKHADKKMRSDEGEKKPILCLSMTLAEKATTKKTKHISALKSYILAMLVRTYQQLISRKLKMTAASIP